jgi:hypothetical protein
MNELDGLVDFGGNSPFDGKILIIDFSNLAYRNAAVMIKSEPDIERAWDRWRGKTFYDIMKYVSEFSPDRLIIALDYKYNWRQKIYPEYKKTAQRAKTKILIDKDRLDIESNQFVGMLRAAIGNIFLLSVDNCEADDIIAVIAKEHQADSQVSIISNDHDFCQLSEFKSIKHFDTSLKKIEVLNPKQHIGIKIIVGDKNDNISSIKEGIGPVKAEEIWINGIDNYMSNNSGTKVIDMYVRNRTLIDFNYIPKEIEKAILDHYRSWVIGAISGRLLMSLFASEPDLCNKQWQVSKEIFKKLR